MRRPRTISSLTTRYTTYCYGSHREFFVTRDAQLAHEKDIQRRAERAGYFMGDRYSTAWQC
jgi:hypothetical protein